MADKQDYRDDENGESSVPSESPPDSHSALVPLVLRYLQGHATPEEIEVLKRSLSEDPEAARLFVDICHQDSHLMQHYSPELLLEDLKLAPFRKDASELSESLQNQLMMLDETGAGRSKSRNLRSTLMWLAAAVLLSVTSYLSIHFYRVSRQIDSPDAVADRVPPLTTSDPDVLAAITRKVDCVWEDEKWKPGSRTHLRVGEVLRLEQGLAELTYGNGTVVLVEGPAQFAAISSMKVALDYGSISVKAAEGLEGFEVATPASSVIDVGTEFGVSVSQTGLTELSVYDGEVKLENASSLSTQDALLLTEESSPESRREAKQSYKIRVTDEALTRRSLDIKEPLEVPELPITKNLALWLSAEASVKMDRSNRVVGWGDLLVGDNQERESAWQVEQSKRPTWVHDGMVGHPAIQFDGEASFLVTEPLATTNEQTITALVQVLGRGDKHRLWDGNQIINYAGPPSLVLRYNWGKAGFAGRAFVGYFPEYEGQKAWVNVGRTVGSRVPRELVNDDRPPQLCSYVFSHRDNIAKLFIDGLLIDEAEAPGTVAIVSSKVIGAHRTGEDVFFKGFLSELLIHNDSLSDEDVVSLHRSISDRYEIQLP